MKEVLRLRKFYATDCYFLYSKCKDLGIKKWSQAEALYNMTQNNWDYFAVTREPIDRFLSGFLNVCLR